MNRNVNVNLLTLINNFFEVIVAPSFDLKAIDILKEKKRLILLKLDISKDLTIENRSTIFAIYIKKEI